MSDNQLEKDIQIVWAYHKLNQEIKKADCILVLGSHDIRVAERAAELFLKGYAPLLIFSGGKGRLTNGWDKSEADTFAEIAINMGVPTDKILVERDSANTGENILNTKALLDSLNIDPQSFIVVQKPYMERRTFATFKKLWPQKDCIVTSPQLSLEDYPNDVITKKEMVDVMVGDLQRIKIYPEKGFQIYQEIPAEVERAYNNLVEAGYTSHLVK